MGKGCRCSACAPRPTKHAARRTNHCTLHFGAFFGARPGGVAAPGRRALGPRATDPIFFALGCFILNCRPIFVCRRALSKTRLAARRERKRLPLPPQQVARCLPPPTGQPCAPSLQSGQPVEPHPDLLRDTAQPPGTRRTLAQSAPPRRPGIHASLRRLVPPPKWTSRAPSPRRATTSRRPRSSRRMPSSARRR